MDGLQIYWSEAVPLPVELAPNSQHGHQSPEDKSLPVTVAFVNAVGETCARQLVVCSSYRRSIHVLCVEDRYVIVNTLSSGLVVYPVLVTPDKKVSLLVNIGKYNF